MNARTRSVALYAIGIIAVLASVDALAHSYTGLYGWALHHLLGGWQAMSWPAEIDVFLVLGELALYVAYMDAWSGRERIWPWASALIGLAVSVAGNVGHIQASPGVTVTMTDRLTAAASPLAAFAGLMIGFLVLKKVRQKGASPARRPVQSAGEIRSALHEGSAEAREANPREETPEAPEQDVDQQLLADAVSIVLDAAASGQPVSQRVLAARLRARGHRFSNAQLRDIVNAASSGTPRAA
jgi:hypothetical protein